MEFYASFLYNDMMNKELTHIHISILQSERPGICCPRIAPAVKEASMVINTRMQTILPAFS